VKSVLQKTQPFFDFCKQLFVFALILYLVLFLLETVFPGFVSYNFDLNKILVVVFVLGFLSVFAQEEKAEQKKEKTRKFTRKDFTFLCILGFLVGIVVFIKTDTDVLTRVMSGVLGGFVISLVAWILLFIDDVEEKETV